MEPSTQPTPVVHVVHSTNPEKAIISPEVQRKHERSQRIYPNLNLSDGEYVIRSVRRHPIGLIGPLILGVFVIAAAFTVMLGYGDIVASLGLTGVMADPSIVVFPGFLLVLVIAGVMAIHSYVYLNNRFYLTNESVIQEIRYSLLSRHEQTVSLANIEDASFTQSGLLQYAFNYGEVRLSTEGDETTYQFSYVANPKEHVAKLNNVVEAFKNGRPVDDD